MLKLIHKLFGILDKYYDFPKGTSKYEVKKYFKIKSISKLEHEEMIYLIRFVDVVLLSLGIDYTEIKK